MKILEAVQLLGKSVVVPSHGSVVLDSVRKDGVCEVSGGYFVPVEEVEPSGFVPESVSDSELISILRGRLEELGEEKFVEVFRGVFPVKPVVEVVPPVSNAVTANSNPLESQTFEPPVAPSVLPFDGGAL